MKFFSQTDKDTATTAIAEAREFLRESKSYLNRIGRVLIKRGVNSTYLSSTEACFRSRRSQIEIIRPDKYEDQVQTFLMIWKRQIYSSNEPCEIPIPILFRRHFCSPLLSLS
jgi:hypothetical protein